MWATVADGGLPLIHHWINVPCLWVGGYAKQCRHHKFVAINFCYRQQCPPISSIRSSVPQKYHSTGFVQTFLQSIMPSAQIKLHFVCVLVYTPAKTSDYIVRLEAHTLPTSGLLYLNIRTVQLFRYKKVFVVTL